ncbi:Similar to hypothetical protein [Tuber melanosporum Mel28]; acc. no. XP_002838133 [Pyronema omphalodes CBS 100304]|uniref:Transcription factor domain-containing protein n=1 Tax=Pyronema omphalodes (strain CBS 100304) TaxID=1076935 RepID=U4LGZ6_PYROM|nr:Similar to hypothetical protein [Tuber melanosporum Mel28]; acc. no. XP_002838133 [Pyronema omphalodes CBS 100304]
MPELMCPVPQNEALEIMENIYSNSTTTQANNHTYPRPAPRTADANYLLCLMLLLAALGARYLADNEVTDDEQAALFTSGRWYLDMAFGIKDANDLQRLRANVLVALNLIFEKRIVSIEYLNRAIAIGLARGLHRSAPPAASRTPPRTATVGAEPDGYAGSRNRQQTMGDGDTQLFDYWPYWKRIWQSLVFVDGWLSTSVGGVPQVCKTLEPISEDLGHLGNPQQQHHLVVHQHGQHEQHGHGQRSPHHPHHPPQPPPHPDDGGDGGCGGANRPSSRDLEGNLHAELARLGVLMGAITKDVIAPETVELNMVRVYNDRLQAWHSTLPEALTLQSAVRNQYELPHKNSTLLIHCAYLLSITHLTRRLLVETATAQLSGSSSLAGVRSGSACSGSSNSALSAGPGASPGGAGEGLLAEPTATAETFSTMCVDVAHQIATVVGMLRAEDKLTRRCWLIIQSAYTAAMIICLDLARNRGRPQLESKFNDSQVHISACIDTLHQSAGSDPVSQRYLEIILPIYRTLTIPDTSLATKRARLYRDPLSGAFGDPGSETYPTNDAVLDTILEYLKAPYGGERTIMDQDFFSAGGAGNFPEHYRFLNPPPSNTRFNTPRQPNGHSQIYAISNGNATPSNGTHDIRMGNNPMDHHQPSPPKNRYGAFKSMEELEAFYRRVT